MHHLAGQTLLSQCSLVIYPLTYWHDLSFLWDVKSYIWQCLKLAERSTLILPIILIPAFTDNSFTWLVSQTSHLLPTNSQQLSWLATCPFLPQDTSPSWGCTDYVWRHNGRAYLGTSTAYADVPGSALLLWHTGTGLIKGYLLLYWANDYFFHTPWSQNPFNKNMAQT